MRGKSSQLLFLRKRNLDAVTKVWGQSRGRNVKTNFENTFFQLLNLKFLKSGFKLDPLH